MRNWIKKISLNELYSFFQEEGIPLHINAEQFQKELQQKKEKKTPIIIQLLLSFGAMVTAGFFLLFLGLADLLDNAVMMMVLGVMILALAIAIPYISNEDMNTEPFAIAALIVGSTLFSVGYTMEFGDAFEGFLWISTVLSAIVIIVANSKLQKFASILVGNLCLFGLIAQYDIPILYNVLAFANAALISFMIVQEHYLLARHSILNRWFDVIVNACSVSLIAVLCFSVNQRYIYDEQTYNHSYWWVTSVMIVILIAVVLYQLLENIKAEQKYLIVGGVFVALLILITAPGILVGCLLFLLGVYSTYWLLAGQGLVALVGFTIMFYYNFETTLLVKSLMMIGAGTLFIAVGFGLKKVLDKQIQKQKQ